MNSLTKFEVNFNGVQFLLNVADGAMMSLNEIYAAAGSPAGKEPWRWLETEGSKQFIDSIMESLHLAKNVILKTSRARLDRGGGTWAHWKIAVRYAAYLAPALDSAILDVFRERVQEEIDPELGITRSRERAINSWKRQGKNEDWIGVRIKTIDTWKSFTDTLKVQGVDSYGYPKCADSFNVPLLGGTAKEVRKERNIVTQNLRDSLDEEELAEIELAQIRAKKKIMKDEVRGNAKCARICFDTSTRIAASR
jgi:hypothetical protein